MAVERRFLVARNPDPDSSLSYLVRLPLGSAGLVLRARETWPRTAKVYCHRAEPGEWHDGLEIVDDVGVRSCVRNGVAVDLVLDRGREHRSQFVFTRIQGGREGIFWQSPKTTRKARPAIRIPGRRAQGLADLAITIDTRERYPYKFSQAQVTTERRKLPAGDYGVHDGDRLAAVVERKSLADLSKSLVDGTLAYQMAELATVPRAAVVVEERYSQIYAATHVSGAFLADLLAQVQVRYPSVTIAFCDTRPLAEQWTYRFLAAALVYLQDHPDDATAPRTWHDLG
ncbi:MAG: ERCC4 domain-containing protein [Acidimicrobiia bacterium]|nr:ERCC4 domain-containing protein [Acidimicrobiia bacterium]MDH4362543.1 ERCC4 domain-containing protein [Acidimicrobiia bacterium]